MKLTLMALAMALITACGVEAGGEVFVTHRLDLSGACPDDLGYADKQACYQSVAELLKQISEENQ